MSDRNESTFDRAHRLEHERAEAVKQPPAAGPADDVTHRLARIETLLGTVLEELRTLTGRSSDT